MSLSLLFHWDKQSTRRSQGDIGWAEPELVINHSQH